MVVHCTEPHLIEQAYLTAAYYWISRVRTNKCGRWWRYGPYKTLDAAVNAAKQTEPQFYGNTNLENTRILA